jgi:hypothetical protein
MIKNQARAGCDFLCLVEAHSDIHWSEIRHHVYVKKSSDDEASPMFVLRPAGCPERLMFAKVDTVNRISQLSVG